MGLKEKVLELTEYPYETEWFDFKESWYQPVQIGEYISALSNAAAVAGEPFGYMVWGITDKEHKIVGTTLDYHQDFHDEPYQHYLARNLKPTVAFEFKDVEIDGKRIVVLKIPAAVNVPTSFAEKRYFRIGSSKVNLSDYPDWESKVWFALSHGIPTMINQPSPYQNLTFRGLFLYYSAKGIELRKETFMENLHLLTPSGEYNLLAALMADNGSIGVRVSVFHGTTKADPMYMVKEFGNRCLLYSIDEIIDFGSVMNVPQADERNRKAERKEVMLFDQKSYNEAIFNAFIHNNWMNLNAPMITFYSDRIEITSFGALPPKQTLEGFYRGNSIPANKELSDIFMQLHLSEKTGRGVPRIVSRYTVKAFDISSDSITVTIPFKRIDSTDVLDQQVGDKVGDKSSFKANHTQERILEEIRNNAHVTISQLSLLIGITEKGIAKNIAILKRAGILTRQGSKKTGIWVIEP